MKKTALIMAGRKQAAGIERPFQPTFSGTSCNSAPPPSSKSALAQARSSHLAKILPLNPQQFGGVILDLNHNIGEAFLLGLAHLTSTAVWLRTLTEMLAPLSGKPANVVTVAS